jgi:hypothetical protein
MLIKEQQEVAARRAEQGGGAGGGGQGEGGGEGEGGEAAGGGGSSGGGGKAGSTARKGEERGSEDRDGREAEGDAGGGTNDRATGSSGARMPREGGRVVTGAPEGAPPAGSDDASRVPVDVGDGHDDDVVARQLREAAMAEEDPAIREKLWDEYRRYKRGES